MLILRFLSARLTFHMVGRQVPVARVQQLDLFVGVGGWSTPIWATVSVSRHPYLRISAKHVCVCAFVKCTPGLFAYSRHFGNWIQLATAKRWDSRARLIGAADPYNVLTAYDCASRTGRWKLETRDRGPGSLVLWLSRASGRGPQLSRTFLGTPKRNYSYKCGEGAKCLGQQNNMQMPMNEFQLGKKTMRMTHECW